MSKFKKKKGGDLPAISTASLPDIVFMLLFFFMVATVMRDNTLMVTNKLPAADQVQKLDKKDRVITYMLVNQVLDTNLSMVTNQKFN
jgi:biopolymer transport protein ExbD